MSENNGIGKDLPEVKTSNAIMPDVKKNHNIKTLDLSIIISSIVLSGALMVSASTIKTEDQPSNIIEYVGGKVEMGKVIAEEASFSFSLYREDSNRPYTITASSSEELTKTVTEFFKNALDDENEEIDRSNKRKQERFESAMVRYKRNLETYNKHLASLEKGEQPRYDAPEKPILEDLKENKIFEDMVLTVDGKVVVSGEVKFKGTITPQFTLELEEREKKFTVEDKFSLPDLIEYIEDNAEDLYSDYEDESLVG
ncbi:hypothetical protein DA096_03195 [Vibrio rotiferianus]|uniref:hypothetical protein n=1 Tax=Vibrio rotiferianus TaxID=190895 RepID=UPI00111035B9|nr:hypothetical protein [Vibrio rotiferianus]TMX43596.1 hypothetical protein DA095_03350 [Vibrio rotiferianus]TMX47680.1 hypothetical protein DA093_17700 [Vibrio rotiferianus]TMX68650.1 hypothetical protein DA096_03195 [Vibrio rotiferianus]CAH1591901.1 hypothetical protein THOG10_60022 [Vibrio rotiferianus]CAH1592905.1 hypothetical protein THOB06_60022 [Vibrio rotiferianus]